MFEHILSRLFPPKLPARVRDWRHDGEESFPEEGWAGPARPKKYRDGIDRVMKEGLEASSC